MHDKSVKKMHLTMWNHYTVGYFCKCKSVAKMFNILMLSAACTHTYVKEDNL